MANFPGFLSRSSGPARVCHHPLHVRTQETCTVNGTHACSHALGKPGFLESGSKPSACSFIMIQYRSAARDMMTCSHQRKSVVLLSYSNIVIFIKALLVE